MNPSSQEEEAFSARSYGLQKIPGREGAATGLWLRLRAAVVAVAVAVLFVLGTGAARRAQAVVFSALNSVRVESVLHNFTGTDGDAPAARLIMDSSGNLYGTTIAGGSTYSSTSGGDGTVFELSPPSTSGGNWTEKVLHTFTGTDGVDPEADLLMDSKGNLYGTTEYGGSTYSSTSSGGGTVFELSPPSTSGGSWTETVLYTFGTNASDGAEPYAGVIMDSAGNLFGTTAGGALQATGPCLS